MNTRRVLLPPLDSDFERVLLRIESLLERQKDEEKDEKEQEEDDVQRLFLQSAQLRATFFAGVAAQTFSARRLRLPPVKALPAPQMPDASLRVAAKNTERVKVAHSVKIEPLESVLRQTAKQPSASSVAAEPPMAINTTLRSFKYAAVAVRFTIKLQKAGLKFRESPSKIAKVLEAAETELVNVLKARKSFFKAIEAICASTAEKNQFLFHRGTSKEVATGFQLRLIAVIDLVLDALEKITVKMLKKRRGVANNCLRALDYIISKDIKFPKKYLWLIEKTERTQSTTLLTTNNRKIAESPGYILILYFTVKVLMKIFCHAVEQGIVLKQNALFEENMVTVLIFLLKSAQSACNHPSTGEPKEFQAGLPPDGVFKVTWVSQPLASAVAAASARLKNWSVGLYNDLDKGSV
ncbi:hypothetical protein BDR26DRAFT_1004843 [Obelidium mucronatum]|nr:hypothetical protein BDR26DRAFT_1004843 [Obelidium mucronatum]